MRRLLAIAMASAVGVVLAATPSAAATDYDPPLAVVNSTTLLDIGYSDLALSRSTGQLFLSGGRDSTVINVANMDGQFVGSIGGQTGAHGLVLSPDGNTVYAALTAAGAISAIDVATWAEKFRWTIGENSCPYDLALAAGRLWFSHGCYSTGPAQISSLDPADPAAAPTFNQGGWWTYAPRLESGSIDDTLLFAVQEGVYPNRLVSFDLSNGQPVRRTALEHLESVTQFAVDPDGESIIVATPGEYQFTSKVSRYTTADLTELGRYAAPGEVISIAYAPDGRVATHAKDGGLALFPKGQYAALWSTFKDFRLGQDPAPRGLALGPEGRIFVVEKYISNSMMNLTAVELRSVRTSLVVGAPASPVLVRNQVTFTGALSAGDGTETGVRTVHVTRNDRRGTVTLPDVQTAADGSFSAVDTPRTDGETSWTFTFGGTDRLLTSSFTVTSPVTRS